MISGQAFAEGISWVEAATGTAFKGQHSDKWIDQFLKEVTEEAFLLACRGIARTWTTMKFPPLAVFLGEIHKSGDVSRKKNVAREKEEEEETREFSAQVKEMETVLGDMDEGERSEFQMEVDKYSQEDRYWQKRYGKNPDFLQEGWDRSVTLHLMGLRDCPVLTHLFERREARLKEEGTEVNEHARL